MMSSTLRTLLAILALLLSGGLLHAQTYTLRPQKWYPLAVGNVWAREAPVVEGLGFSTYYVAQIDRDTVVGDRRWFHHRYLDVRCMGPYCYQPDIAWLSWTDDAYLLKLPRLGTPAGTLDFSNPDTLDKTTPRSAFAVRTALDTTLHSRWLPPTQRVFTEIIGPRADYPLTDSTLLRLSIRIHPWYSDQYRYGVGPYPSIGAIIGGVPYGDTSWIRQVVGVERTLTSVSTGIQVFPNPARGVLIVRAPVSGWVVIYDGLGRARLRTEVTGNTTRLDVSGLSPGAYVVRTAAGALPVVIR